MFIRIKRGGSLGEYGYLVENYWVNGSSRQRIKSYLGKICGVESVHDVSAGLTCDGGYSEVILELVKNELIRHGFQEKEGIYFLNGLFVNIGMRSIHDSKGKRVVLKLNDGFLCDYHLQRLVEYKKNPKEKIKGMELANLLVSAGLRVKPEDFVEVYKRVE